MLGPCASKIRKLSLCHDLHAGRFPGFLTMFYVLHDFYISVRASLFMSAFAKTSVMSALQHVSGENNKLCRARMSVVCECLEIMQLK